VTASQSADALNRRRKQCLGSLLSLIAMDVDRRLFQELRKRGYRDLRRTHYDIVACIALEGTRQVEIARRLGRTRQAIGRYVEDLEALGYVKRKGNPLDLFSHSVVYTKRGRQLLDDWLAVLEQIDTEYASELGRGRMIETRRALTEVVRGLSLDLDAAPAKSEARQARR
jgi:DNA-binding MarR family transcriptional regulator